MSYAGGRKSGRDVPASDRTADKENPLPAAPTIPVDVQARQRALRWVGGLSQALGEVESSLATLKGFVDDDALGSAVVGAIGISATEIRQQVPALRQAIRDIPLEGEGRS